MTGVRVRNTSESAAAGAWTKRAFSASSAAKATPTATRWPKQSTVCTRSNGLIAGHRGSAQDISRAGHTSTSVVVHHRRLLEPIGYILPAETAASQYLRLGSQANIVDETPRTQEKVQQENSSPRRPRRSLCLAADAAGCVGPRPFCDKTEHS